MIKINNEKGFSVTVICALIVVIMIILTQPLCSIVFYARDMAMTDRLIQQAWYNANSGVEYGRFIIEHGTVYDPLRPDAIGSPPGRVHWPKGVNTAADNTFQCFDTDPAMGTARVSIVRDGASFVITSRGRAGNVPEQIATVRITAGRVETWQ